MRHYLAELAYDGAPFFGWQSQPHGNTVQDHLEAAVSAALGQTIRFVGASRTDSGVHAEQQFAVFSADAAWNSSLAATVRATLHPAITVRAVQEIPVWFHPGRQAALKRYCYRVRPCDPRDQTLRPRQWSVRRAVDFAILRAELRSVEGTHDFSSFCAADSNAARKVRTLAPVRVETTAEGCEIWFEGRGFLKQMLRLLVGAAMARATAQKGSPPLRDILAQRDRLAAGRCAPAQGLTLTAIELSRAFETS